jgi:glycosyltransferase involved in cell wall biosynthesis
MERVLFLIKAREFGGLEIVLLDWLSCIEYSKASVVICCYGTDTLTAKLDAMGLPVERVKLTIPDYAPPWKALPSWLRLFSSIQSHKIVFIEAMVGEFGVIPVLAAWLSNRGGVFLFEANWGRSIIPASSADKKKLHFGFLPGIGWYRYKEIFKQQLRARFARETFVVSRGIKNNLVANYAYPASRTSVLYHGVDIQRFRASSAERIEFRRSHGIPNDATVIVSHGRLARRKRIDRILKAIEVLSAEDQNLWLLLTAYGPVKEEVERAVAKSSASHRVKLLGFQEDSSRILKASDIYVLSSDDEGFGIALVEALSTGLVCVATTGPGPRDIIADGENGFLVEATDEGVLLGLRRALSLDGDGRRHFAHRARKTVEERFEISTAIQTALEAMEIPRQQPGMRLPTRRPE